MSSLDKAQADQLLHALMTEAIAAANPAIALPAFLPTPPTGRTVVLGAGKASAAMARAVEENWQGKISGLIVTRYGFACPCKHIEVVEAAHPVPDAAGREAASRVLKLAAGLGSEDLCLTLMSGGASALLVEPVEGITLTEKQEVNRLLLGSGANITEMNTVRKHLSAIKGGRLARALNPAKIITLMISDVPGDDPGVIGSGPTVPDQTTFADAIAVIKKYNIKLPSAVHAYLERGVDETPKPGDYAFVGAEHFLVSRPQQSLDAAALIARKAGIEVIMLGDQVEGEARDVAQAHANLVKDGSGPRVYLSGGELTVTMKGNGKGGPNTEYMLAMAIALAGNTKVHALAVDTDGIDGSEDNAGALIEPDILERARIEGIDPRSFLANNDSYSFFAQTGGLVMTGPTLTNVNDFRAILVLS